MATESSQTPDQTPTPRTAAPGPRPTPERMPGRIATPGPLTADAPAPQPQSSIDDAARFGRITDDGTVYRIDADGETEIGQWQAGSVDEGLAHFAARYDDLATEISVLHRRIASHPEDSDAIIRQAEKLLETVPNAAVIGDIAELEDRLRAIVEAAGVAKEEEKTRRDQRREEAIARKEKLLEEAEDLSENSTQWKAAGDRIREILTEWKTIRGIDQATDDKLWRRYAAARDAFHRRRGAHFAQLDKERAESRRRKEDLAERAEALKDSTDWHATADAFRKLMREWKAAGRAPREADDKLWARFRAAQDQFFDARRAVNEEKDREFEANAAAKEQLLAEYDPQIDPEKNLDQARAKLAELQEKWEAIGFVPRNRIHELEDRIAAVERRVAEHEESQWRRNDPDALARVDQFRARARDLAEQAAAARETGNDAKAENLSQQAEQWESWAQTAQRAVEDR